jgi:hypothetical protein
MVRVACLHDLARRDASGDFLSAVSYFLAVGRVSGGGAPVT